MNPIQKYKDRVKLSNSLLCVGLDSDLGKIPPQFKTEVYPQFAFNKWVIDQTHEFVAAYKPNLAFFEARGELGAKELKMTMEYVQQTYPDIFTIGDAKRGDIGSTNEGYVAELFDWYGFDSVTLQPYLGQEALQPFLDRDDKVSIVLCRTSNPGAPEFQDLKVDGKELWRIVAERVATQWNKKGNCMLVAGATYPAELAEIRQIVGDMILLVPGIGAQGGDVEKTVKAGMSKDKAGIIISTSRAVIFAKDPADVARKMQTEINLYRS